MDSLKVHDGCGATDVYRMRGRDGKRNKRFLWTCRDCGDQYTVRIGTVFEDSRIPLRHWCYAFWAACVSCSVLMAGWLWLFLAVDKDLFLRSLGS